MNRSESTAGDGLLASAILEADVLVIGGGPAGVWAAYTAASQGAKVVLAEKGFVGTGGATAAGNTTTIHTPPRSAERDAVGWAGGTRANRSFDMSFKLLG